MAEKAGEGKAPRLPPWQLDDYSGHDGHRDNSIMSHTPAWTVAEAKAKFSQMLEQARSGPLTITRNGRPAAVVVSFEEWQRRSSRMGNLAQFLAASPLRDSRLKTERRKDRPRDIEL
jgi:prevent-host-death family protein